MVLSPLLNSQDCTKLVSYSANDLIRRWQTQFGIDITNELTSVEEISLWQCNITKLYFFEPKSVAGSDALYRSLAHFNWYYMPDKWEYDVAIDALKHLPEGSQLLEIGCGNGFFLKRLKSQLGLNPLGIELNTEAANAAREQGLDVLEMRLSDLAARQATPFDAVCAFQVLEHVPAPLTFLQEALALLKPGGLLLLAVPNQDSFIKNISGHLLNMPPHHMTQWTPETFRHLDTILPIRLQSCIQEPLSAHQVDWYCRVQASRLGTYRFTRYVSKVAFKAINPFLKHIGWLRRTITGHTLYVSFEKLV